MTVKSKLPVGLDGYSPVALSARRKWVKGDKRHQAVFKGIVYNLANEKELKLFAQKPEQYAPRLLGCDPVVLWNTDRAISGSTQYGAFYSGELFLFISPGSRKQFKANPRRYIRARHALLPEHVERPELRRAAIPKLVGPQ